MSIIQKTFDFEPIEQKDALVFPIYWRKNIPGQYFKGESPREGFLKVNELVRLGYSEEKIDSNVVQWGQKRERTFIKRLLAKMGTGYVVIDNIQQKNANALRTALLAHHNERKGLTDMELLWWWYELDTRRLLQKKSTYNKLGKGDKICIDKAHCTLGRFRHEITQTYHKLMNSKHNLH